MSDTISIPSSVQELGAGAMNLFFECLDNGTSPKLAEMLACQSPPRVMTDAVFLEGHGRLGDNLTPPQLAVLKRNAKKRGITIGENDVYMSSLAQESMDPMACVPATGGRGHVKKVCEMYGMECDGAVKVNGAEVKSSPIPSGMHLSDDTADGIVENLLQMDPKAAKESRADLRKHVKDSHGLSDKNLSGEFSCRPPVKPTFTSKDLPKKRK